jgi:hypothetical protein
MFSCSNEHEGYVMENVTTESVLGTTTARPTQVIENEIDEVFYEYFNSQEYADAYDVIDLFNNKVNNSYIIKNSKTKTELFNWIGSNLELTNFFNIEEANTLWNHKTNLQNLKFNKYPQFLDIIKRSDSELILLSYEKWEPIYYTESSNKPCWQQTDDCRAEARARFIQCVKEVKDGDGGIDAVLFEEDAYVDAQNACKDAYNACIKL